MEYVTEEQLEEFGMNIMHITGGHVKLIDRLVAQCEQQLDAMDIMRQIDRRYASTRPRT